MSHAPPATEARRLRALQRRPPVAEAPVQHSQRMRRPPRSLRPHRVRHSCRDQREGSVAEAAARWCCSIVRLWLRSCHRASPSGSAVRSKAGTGGRCFWRTTKDNGTECAEGETGGVEPSPCGAIVALGAHTKPRLCSGGTGEGGGGKQWIEALTRSHHTPASERVRRCLVAEPFRVTSARTRAPSGRVEQA